MCDHMDTIQYSIYGAVVPTIDRSIYVPTSRGWPSASQFPSLLLWHRSEASCSMGCSCMGP